MTWLPLLFSAWKLPGLSIHRAAELESVTRFQTSARPRICSYLGLHLPHRYDCGVGRGCGCRENQPCGSQCPSAAQREARAIYSRRRLPAGVNFPAATLLSQQHPNAASTFAQSSSVPVIMSSGSGILPLGSNAQASVTHLRLGCFTACHQGRPEG